MDVISQIKELVEKKEFEKAEALCVSVILKLPYIEELYDVLADIFIQTGNLKILNIPLNDSLVRIILNIGNKLLNKDINLISEYYKKIYNENNKSIIEELAKIFLSKGLDALEKNIEIQFRIYFKLAFEFNIDRLYAFKKIVIFTYDRREFITKISQELIPLVNYWDGKEYKDKTLLLYSFTGGEGSGDCIHFIRVLYSFKNYFNKIKIIAQPKLIELFKYSFSSWPNTFIEFFSENEEKLGEYDYIAIAMLTNFQSKLEATQKYLIAKPEKINYFKEKYFSTIKPKVGICWHGSENKAGILKFRDIPIKILSNIFSLNRIQYYSLQKDLNEDIENYPNIINLAYDFEDFSDTAAAVENLDLVITVDTSIVHLAGALGKKTFLMLPYETFEWWVDKNSLKVYDSVEIFQQKELNVWDDVVDRIKDRLIQEYKTK